VFSRSVDIARKNELALIEETAKAHGDLSRWAKKTCSCHGTGWARYVTGTNRVIVVCNCVRRRIQKLQAKMRDQVFGRKA